MRNAIFIVIIFAISSSASEQPAPTTELEITTRKSGDTLTYEVENGQAVIVVNSQSGIGNAVVRRQAKAWPDTVVLRLHLQGLEYFRVSNGKTQLEASASVREGKSVIRIWRDGNENAPLSAESLYWMKVVFPDRGREDKKRIPLKEEPFEIRLPKALFEANPESITLDWIDFYR